MRESQLYRILSQRPLSPEEAQTFFGSASITSASLPSFSATEKSNSFGELFYAMLKTNERNDRLETRFESSLSGTFLGIGLGNSLALIQHCFAADFTHALLCEREPYIYLVSRAIQLLSKRADSFTELLLMIVDRCSFKAAYLAALKEEPKASPVFLRGARMKMIEEMPPEIDQLRRMIFIDSLHKLTKRDAALFDEAHGDGAEKLRWVQHYLRYKAPRLQLLLDRRYADFAELLQHKISLVCCDFFHPALWRTLAEAAELWSAPSMIYFSNAAVYSLGSAIRKEAFSVSHPYTPELVRQLPGAGEGRHYIVFTERGEHYMTTAEKSVPSPERLLATFRRTKKPLPPHAPSSRSAPHAGCAETEKALRRKSHAPEQPWSAIKGPFRISGGARRGGRGKRNTQVVPLRRPVRDILD